MHKKKTLLTVLLILPFLFLIGTSMEAYSCCSGENPGFESNERGNGPASVGVATYFPDNTYLFEGICEGVEGSWIGNHTLDFTTEYDEEDFIGSRDEIIMEVNASLEVTGCAPQPTVYDPDVVFCGGVPGTGNCKIFEMVIVSAHDLMEVKEEDEVVALTLNVVTLFVVPKNEPPGQQ